MAESKEKAGPEVIDALNEIVDMRRELLDQLNKQLSNQLSLSINLQINQQQLTSVYGSLQDTLTQQIFWVNSNKPVDLAWLKAMPEAVRDQLAGLDIKFDGGKLLQGGLNALVFLIPMLLAIGLLRWRYRLIDGHLQKLANDVGQLKRDGQLHTPKAIALTLLKVLPAPRCCSASVSGCIARTSASATLSGRCRSSWRCHGWCSASATAC